MSATTGIEWTEATWNPVTGCTKVSPGCAHCYAETFANRFRGVPGHPYERGFALTLRPERLELPLGWKRPRMIFVNSMSDLFHEGVDDAFVGRVFETMERARWHTFQVLTKRPERALALAGALPWPDNVWLGVSVESRRFLHRLDALRGIPAALRFASCEPLLGPLDGIDLTDIGWVICGGESGPRARRMSRSGRARCGMRAWGRACRSSSSSGGRTTRRGVGWGRGARAASSTGAAGTGCRRLLEWQLARVCPLMRVPHDLAPLVLRAGKD